MLSDKQRVQKAIPLSRWHGTTTVLILEPAPKDADDPYVRTLVTVKKCFGVVRVIKIESKPPPTPTSPEIDWEIWSEVA